MVKKQPKQPRVKIETTTSPGPWINGQVDLVGPVSPTSTGKRYILTLIDEFFSWVELRSLEDRSAESVLKALDQIFSIRGPTLNLQTDNALEFTSELVQKYLRDLGVYWNQICPYKPTTNGKVERMNGKIKVALRLSDATELNWDESLPSLQLSLNLTRQKCGYSAFQLIHGWTISRPAWLVTEQKRKGTNCDLPDDKKVAWARNAVARMARVFAEKVGHEEALKAAAVTDKLTNTFEDLKEGQRCLVHFKHNTDGKIFSPWRGIFTIRKQIDKNCFIVEHEGNARKKYVVDRVRLRPIRKRTFGSEKCEQDLQNKEDSITMEMTKETIAKKNPEHSELTVKHGRPMREAAAKAAAKIRELSI